jgi:hypothetical protein
MSIPAVAPADKPLSAEMFAAKPTNERPRVALLDGLAMTGHVALNERLIVDDPGPVGPNGC